uniref:NADAR domain-containing protein n=1 Tax=Panagrolaimus superbus TaxID=310955 RepID=A0A914Z1E1_9BILA
MAEGAQPNGNRQQNYGKPGGNRQNNGNNGGNFNVQQELNGIKQEMSQLRDTVDMLEQEKDSLRKAIRKLKLENEHMKKKYKRLQEKVGDDRDGDESAEIEADYDEIGRDFILVGGIHDPLALRFQANIKDENGIQHKSAERYYWYKMAEVFNDEAAKKGILDAQSFNDAEEAMKEIKDFKESTWNEHKMKVWEKSQTLKLEQNRWIANLLVFSDKTYIAVATQDKYFGTGWRKNRDEANKPIYWDGENQGGKSLMRLRKLFRQNHEWKENEEDETRVKYNELRRYTWRRVDPTKRFQMNGHARGRRGNFRPYSAR